MRLIPGKSARCGAWMTLALVLFTCGCGSGEPALKTVPVSGTVTLDDKPLVAATVRFFAESGNNVSVAGTTDLQGKYKLGVANYDGAPPGNYKVVVSSLVDLTGNPIKSEPGKDSMMLMMEGKAKELLHANYSNLGMTSLKAEVKAGGKPIDFKLRTDGT